MIKCSAAHLKMSFARDSMSAKKEGWRLRSKNILAIPILVVSLFTMVGMALAAQDRFTLKAPNGVAFSEFKGYDTGQNVAPSQTDEGIKVILANATMINARQWQAFSRGLRHRKNRMVQKKNPESPYLVMVPDTVGYFQALRERQLIREDSLLPVPYGCKGKRRHFHELRTKVRGTGGIPDSKFERTNGNVRKLMAGERRTAVERA